MARLLHELSGTRATFVITARRCLLAGVLVFPVTAPLVTSGRAAFPRVGRLTRTLRWNPLALDIADSIVASGAAKVTELEAFLHAKNATRVCVIDHEDDLPEVALLVAWAWARLRPESRRVLGVLSHIEGDHVDVDSLATLARIGGQRRAARSRLCATGTSCRSRCAGAMPSTPSSGTRSRSARRSRRSAPSRTT